MGDTMQRPRKRRWGNELARQRRARLADFAQRGAFEPGDVLRHARRGWVYVPVHAMADEHDRLAALGLAPADCTRVDCYWRSDDDVCFLEVVSRAIASRPVGYVARWWHDDPPQLHVQVLEPAAELTRGVVEAAMERVVATGGLDVPIGRVRRWVAPRAR